MSNPVFGMDLSTSIFLGIALAMDCFAISITIGLKEGRFNIGTALRTSIAFGGFQALMPIIGWYGTMLIQDYIVSYGPWVAFFMLALIGGRMIWESIKGEESGDENVFDVSKWGVLMYLAIATSIDALAVGVSYGALGVDVCMPAFIIGVFSALFSVVGLLIGSAMGNVLGNKAELIGGIVLCVLGIKILLENLL